MKYTKPCILGYSRVSSEMQKQFGGGIKRQETVVTEAGKRLEIEHNLPFVGVVKDEAKSAFKGDNITDGIMGDIIDGKIIRSGSILIIENFDRLSRQDPLEVLHLLRTVLKQGIRIYIAHRNELIDSVSIADTSQILTSILSISLAHEESLKKSKRMKVVYDKQLEEAKSGKATVKIGRAPSWLVKSNDKWELVPERAKILKKIVDMYLSGMGAGAIAEKLNTDKIPPFKTVQGQKRNNHDKSSVWHSSTISRFLANDSLVGTATFKKTGEEDVVIPDYYPKVISRDVFNRLIQYRKDRSTINKGNGGGRKSLVPAFLTGTGLIRCGYCDSGVIAKSDSRSSRKNSKITRSLVCSGFVKKYSLQCAGGSMNAKYLEDAILKYCSNEINFGEVFGNESEELQTNKEQLADEQEILSRLSNQQKKLMQLFALDEEDDEILLEQIKEQKIKINHSKSIIQDLEDKINSAVNSVYTNQEQFTELVKDLKADNLPDDTRNKLRILLPKFIDHIQMYTFGSSYKSDTEEYETQLRDMGVDKELITHMLEQAKVKDRKNGAVVVVFKTGIPRMINPYLDYTYGGSDQKITTIF